VSIEACRTTLVGQFVDLRPLTEADAEITFGWRTSPRAFLLNRGADSIEAQRAWIRARPSRELNYVIALKSGAPVGMLSLIDIDLYHRHAESARFLIGEEALVRGVPAAAEAMKLLYEVAFERLMLTRVYGVVGEDNKLMIKWQLYLGMRQEGRLRKHLFLNGRFQDVMSVGILDEEYRNTALPRLKGLIAMASKAQESKEHG